MCGIIGIVTQQKKSVSQADFRAACQSLIHRGPDDGGEFFGNSVALGHRRLSILDLSSAGHQPMSTPDGRYTIVFNGEIYNYQELRDQYLGDVSLISTSDTEVLLHLLARFGFQSLPWLKGMFAFALWDRDTEKMWLARDPFGKKPLYYMQTAEEFVFASEIKAILAYQQSPPSFNDASQERYFFHEYVPSPATAFTGIAQLPMGHYLMLDSQRTIHITQWWRPLFQPKLMITERQALTTMDELLSQAVQRRMVADVPVGVFLSGGLDSTTIAWYMKRASRGDLHSCSISFSEPTFDESSFITQAATQLQTIHHAAHFEAAQVPVLLPRLMVQMDTPLADASLLPTFVVSTLAREHMKVVLSGDGADELCGGYGTFQAAEMAERLSYVPSPVWQLIEFLVRYLPVSHDYFSFDFKLKSFVRGLTYSLARRNQIWLGSFSPTEISHLLQRPQLSEKELFVEVDTVARSCQGLNTFDAVSNLTIHQYLQDDILVKLDRATMMVGLEARVPFLDLDLAEFILKLPVRFKQNKYLLKKLMRGRIPDAIINRPKKGFGLPLGHWMQTELKSWLVASLSQERVEAMGWRWGYVQELLHEHLTSRVDHRKKLWTLLVWLTWADVWASKQS